MPSLSLTLKEVFHTEHAPLQISKDNIAAEMHDYVDLSQWRFTHDRITAVLNAVSYILQNIIADLPGVLPDHIDNDDEIAILEGLTLEQFDSLIEQINNPSISAIATAAKEIAFVTSVSELIQKIKNFDTVAKSNTDGIASRDTQESIKICYEHNAQDAIVITGQATLMAAVLMARQDFQQALAASGERAIVDAHHRINREIKKPTQNDQALLDAIDTIRLTIGPSLSEDDSDDNAIFLNQRCAIITDLLSVSIKVASKTE